MNPAETGAMSILVQQPGAAQGEDLFKNWLERKGLSDATIQNYRKMLRLLVEQGADLQDPESVKETLARNGKSGGWKALAVNAYTAYLKMLGRTWEKPRIGEIRRIPFIPTESEIDCLISGCGPKTSVILQVIKETGGRINEVLRLTWKDVDLERRIVTLNQPEKNSNPRIFKVSNKLVEMLSKLPRTGDKVFNIDYHSLRVCFKNSKKRLAEKLSNPRLKQITFHSIRHWKATIEYHKTRDIMLVKEMLGHKSLNNTLIYVQIERALFGSSSDDEFIVKITKDPDEIKSLLETGFEYVCSKDDLLFFRKRR